MKIDDLLILAGSHRLDTYGWGLRLVDVVNFMANDGAKVNATMTGTEAHSVMRGLPSAKLLKMLMVDLDIATGDATGMDEQLPAPVLEATPPVTPVTPPMNDGEWGQNDYEIEPPNRRHKDWKIQRKHVLGLAMGLVIVMIALSMAGIVTVTTIRTGTPTDSRGLVSIVQVMGDVVKSMFTSDSQAQPYGTNPYGTAPYGPAPYDPSAVPAGPIGGPIGGPAPPIQPSDTAAIPPDDE